MKSKYSFIGLLILSFLVLNCKPSENKNAWKQKHTAIQSLSDDALLDLVQRQTFNYFWEGAEPNSGLAPERIHMDGIYPKNDQSVVTLGGSGFGFMAIIVGVERGFITREQAVERYAKAINFLEKADRFHGAWAHWLNGKTGESLHFSKKDDGGDLVETAFLMQGLLTVKEFLNPKNTEEKKLINKITKLWEEVEWDWYTKGSNDGLYWHWSPNYAWDMNFEVHGYNECLIMYILAASSPTHGISKAVYDNGWAMNGEIKTNDKLYGLDLVLDHYYDKKPQVGPLFWAHYSYLGLNPKGLKDKYADYWKLNKNHALIHYEYAKENPKKFKGYSDSLWGLTSSYSVDGYTSHRPIQDVGVIAPTAALSSMPYTPKESMKVLRNLYQNYDSLIGKYGPYDAFSLEHHWYLPRYLAIDQGPIPVMIENYRTGLLWHLFMKNKDIKSGLKKLEFTIDKN